MQRSFLHLLLIGLLCSGASMMKAELPPPEPANPLFKGRPFGPVASATPIPQKKRNVFEEEKPIPREWIIAGIAAGVLLTAAVLYGSARRWRESNLFDRQYRFPPVGQAAARFGAEKCGGHMATVRFGSEAKDT